jgi:hypothetical protein
MQKCIGLFLISILFIAVILVTGCTNSGSNPVAVTTLTPTTATVQTSAPITVIMTTTAPIKTTITTTVIPGSSSAPGSTHLSGSGYDVKSFVIYSNSVRVFDMSYSGEGNFIVWLKNSQGDNINNLANDMGSFKGTKSQQLEAGKYYLDVSANGPWTIDILSK